MGFNIKHGQTWRTGLRDQADRDPYKCVRWYLGRGMWTATGTRDTAAANAPIWRDQLLAPITLLLIVQTHHSAHRRHQTLYLTPALLGGMVTNECNQ